MLSDCPSVDLRLWQLEMRRSFALKDAVDKDAILSVTDHIEVVLIVMDLNMSARYEWGVTHIHVYVTSTAVPSDDNPVLSYHEFKLSGLEPCDGLSLNVRRVLYARRTGRRRLQRQQSPGVAIGRSAEVWHVFGDNRHNIYRNISDCKQTRFQNGHNCCAQQHHYRQ